MKRAIIVGAGKNYQRWKESLESKFQVIGIVDNAWQRLGNTVHPVEWIIDIDYDMLVVTPNDYESLYHQLIDLGVEKQKIQVASLQAELFCNYQLGNRYYGQFAEDLILSTVFVRLGVKKPSYIDIGAHHPWLINNTALMYEGGGRGINVDASKESIALFCLVRPEDTNLNLGVSSCRGEQMFYMFGDVNGRNSASLAAVDNFKREDCRAEVKEVRAVSFETLNDIVERYCPQGFPDFLNCDLEGLDYEVLNACHLLEDGPKVVCVEVGGGAIARFDDMMEGKGFFRFCRIGTNNIYAQKRYSKALRFF